MPRLAAMTAKAPGICRAVAHSNIALAKYWGKRDAEKNLPDVPSLSLTLAALSTVTRVHFDPSAQEDEFVLNGTARDLGACVKVRRLLDRVRRDAGLSWRARVESTNDFPTASGLASSASGFAALALASSVAAGSSWPTPSLSALARSASVSAARSIFGGFVALEAGAAEASELNVSPAAQESMMVIAVTDPAPKAVASTQAMQLTQATSPYYSSFVAGASAAYQEIRTGLLTGDLTRVGEAMEQSALMMHACMLAARPAILYWNAGTINAMQRVRELRRSGIFSYFTIDAGPHVKVLTSLDESLRVADELKAIPGVQRVIVSGSGAGARVIDEA